MTTSLPAAHEAAPSGAPDLSVRVGPLSLTSPVMPASGCFGPELAPLLDIPRLGAVVTKTVFPDIRSGNPAHRLTQVAGGMINAVGIPSPGTDGFLADVLPAYLELGAPVIVSIGGLRHEEYLRIADALEDAPLMALEVNVSCPNLEHGGLEMGADPNQLRPLIEDLRARSPHPLLVKLTPNVSDIGSLAVVAAEAGADGITVTNTFVGMAIDQVRRRPVLGNITGGVSGPGIKSLALRAVHEVAHAVELPVVGCGGITSAADVVDFFLAGASAVQVGTATFTHPDAMTRILDDLPPLLTELGVNAITDLTRGLSTFDPSIPESPEPVPADVASVVTPSKGMPQ